MRAEFGCKSFNVDLLQQVLDRLTADLRHEAAFVRHLQFIVVLRERSQDLEELLFRDQVFALEAGQPGVHHDIGFVVNDLLEIFRGHAENVPDLGRQRAEVPDMHHRNRKGDVPHAFATDAFLGDFHAAAITDDAAVADPLVFAAMAFPIPHRPENLLTEQTILLGPERPVIDRLGLGHLTVRTGKNHVRRREADGDLGERLACFSLVTKQKSFPPSGGQATLVSHPTRGPSTPGSTH